MNNDLISRSALKEAFLNHSCTEFEIKNKCRADENVIALIDNAPTVEPQKVLIANVTFDEEKLKELAEYQKLFESPKEAEEILNMMSV